MQLLLITYEFPYGRNETFLENEIAYLTEEFSTVWVLPSRAFWSREWFHKARSESRVLPSGCKVVLPNARARKGRFDIGDFFNLLRCASFNKSHDIPMLAQVKLVVREAIKASLLCDAIRELCLPVDERFVAYSYWKTEAATALALLKSKKTIPSFLTRCHRGDLYYEILNYPIRLFDPYISEQCDCVVPISGDGVQYLKGKGFDEDKLVLSRLGVRVPETVVPVRSNDGVLRVVSCSNIIPVKRVDLLCDALAKLKVPFEWTHFGDGPYRNDIEASTQNFPTWGHANFCGRVSNAEVLAYYATHPVDVFVNVSSSEGVPVSIMEAMAAGIPCIATDVGGTSEIVSSECGLLVNELIDSAELALSLQSAAINQSLWAYKGLAALSRMRERCNADYNYRKFCKLLTELGTDVWIHERDSV